MIEVRRLSGALGAELFGVDLARGIDGETVGAIREALLEHLVVFFRDQHLEPEQFLDFARKMGRVIEYPFVRGLDGLPEITPVVKLEHETTNFGGVWHSDTAYLEEPPMGTLLLAREVPPYGGDTLFANMQLAYDTLSFGMRRMLDGLVAINSSGKADVSKTREDRVRSAPGEGAAREFTAEHPVVRLHPESGRKSLYVSLAHTVRFCDMSAAESAPILEFLHRHQTRAELTCRFRWQPGSIAFWDNRATQHYPLNDYHGHRRVMHRITLAGDRPRGPASP